MKRLACCIALGMLGCATAKPGTGTGTGTGTGSALKLVLPNVPGPGETNFGALKGKVVLIDFWATWCGPCHEAGRAYEKLYEKLHANGLEVYGISIDEDASMIPEFVKEQGITYPIVLDQGGELAQSRFSLEMVPATMIVDRAGRIRFQHGGFDEGVLAKIESEIQQLLAEHSPDR